MLWPLPIVLITLFGANGLGSPEIPGRPEAYAIFGAIFIPLLDYDLISSIRLVMALASAIALSIL
jgi:hypothetical protein